MDDAPPTTAPAPTALSFASPRVHLRCPGCGRTRHLRHAVEWPGDLWQMIALCPQCEGHGHDSALLMYTDGRIVAEHPGRDAPRQENHG